MEAASPSLQMIQISATILELIRANPVHAHPQAYVRRSALLTASKVLICVSKTSFLFCITIALFLIPPLILKDMEKEYGKLIQTVYFWGPLSMLTNRAKHLYMSSAKFASNYVANANAKTIRGSKIGKQALLQ